jgi:NifU-like protein involved in Fe-S cluster formation
LSLDDSIIQIYTEELIALSQEAARIPRVENPDISAKAVSPICGSEVFVEMALSGDKIKTFGFTVEACALTKAVLATLAKAAPGKTRAEVAQAGRAMKAMLEGGEAVPSGDWKALSLLEKARDYPARHNAILLPFEAVERAFAARQPPA